VSAGTLRLAVYDVASSGEHLAIAAGGVRFLYAPAHPIDLFESGATRRIAPDDGAFIRGPFALAGAGWLFECAPAGQRVLAGPGVALVLSQRLSAGFAAPCLLRADRVASDAGAETPRHRHRGPGIRRLVNGRILATIGTATERLDTGRAWFESGRDPVVGRNISGGENVFVRVMVLPPALAGGQTSFIPTSPEEALRPRAVRYRVFGEDRYDI
jgi:hypothetical protein